MAYSDFDLKKVKNQFGLQLVENQSLFSEIAPLPISDYLKQTLKRNLTLAQAINTEHPEITSEMFIASLKKLENNSVDSDSSQQHY